MLSTILALTLALLAQGRVIVGASEELAAAKVLYAAGTYEEALTRLSAARGDKTADEADQYIALCQLALGQTADARRTLEGLVTRSPLFRMSDADVSPRLVTLFRDVRKKLLPAAVRDAYAKAKTSFEQKSFPAASTQFKEMLSLLADEDLAGDTSGVFDLKLLSEGFLRLSEIEVEAAAKAAAAKSAAAAVAATPTPAPPPLKIYTDTDKDVRRPVDVMRPFPEWRPPTALAQRTEYRGLLRIVVNEQGKVESADMVDPVNDVYDPLLLAATSAWEFRPAVRNGVAVKYQELIVVLLSPR
jgi:hypothetical protein